ncbi:MAG: low molecular weight phosphotyrosine protein phosphatase [Anaerolineae bacterium]|nr:low molecular weight phosphotyrosine protein phosphatase [Anaerolineae bacterium]RIK18959.1 MAG: protein tyrosine phosphatase [Anaerolineae bacterium]
MPNVLIICTANICRSPVAAAMLQDRLRKRGLANWTVRSAGTWAIVARGASRYSIDVSRRGGLDISNHRARMVDEDQMNQADLVLTMEVGHAEALRAEFPKQAHKVYMLTEMTGHAYNVPDPYGGPLEGYEQMYDSLGELIDGGLDRIIDLAQKNTNGRG